MNNKVTLQDLADQLSNISGQSKKLSEAFLRALTEIIEDSLEKDGIAKVKGIGTFKIITIEERKSVSVTDGSAVVIPAHKKITFTPEKELKEAVNKPYEHLETYILPNDGPVDAVSDEEEEESYIEEEIAVVSTGATAAMSANSAAHATETVSDEKIAAIADLTPQEQPNNVDIDNDVTTTSPSSLSEGENEASNDITATPIEIQTTSNPSTEEAIGNQPATEPEKIEESVVDEREEFGNTAATAESTTAIENAATNNEATLSEDSTKEAAENELNDKKENNTEDNNNGKKSLLVVIILLILLILACLHFALSNNKAVKDQFIGFKDRITNIVCGDKKPVEPLHPATVDTPEPAEETEGEPFFPETEDAPVEESVEPEFAETPTAQEAVNYDWFEKEFKTFIKREHPKIHVEVMGEPIIDTIKAGKTLTAMSRKYYNGGKDFWVYIYLYNKDVIRRPDDVPAGTVIKIPQLHPSMVNPGSYESVNAAKDVKESYLRLFN